MGLGSVVRIVITGDTKGAQAALAETRAEAGKTGSSFKSLGKMAAVGGLAVAAAAVAVGSMLVKAGDKLNESQDMLKNALKDTGQSSAGLQDKLKPLMSQMQKWGYTNDEVNDGLAALVRAGDKVSTATSDMALAANIAKGRNIDLTTAEQLLVKVRTGHVSLLGRYGIAVKDANGNIISQQEAISKLSGMYSGAANTSAESLKGKTEALKAAFGNLTEHLGQKLIPILTSVAEWFVNTFIPDFANGVTVLEQAWNRVWAAVAPVIAKIQGYIEGFVRIVMSLWDRFGGTLISYTTSMFGSIKTYIKGILDVIEGVFHLFADLLTGKWGKLWGDILDIFRGLWQIITGVVGAAFTTLKALVGLAWDAIGSTVKKGVSNAISFVAGMPGKILSFFDSLPGKMFDVGKAILQGVIHGLGDIGKELLDTFTSGLGGLVSGVKSFLGIHSPSRVFYEIGSNVMQGFTLGIGDQTNNVVAATKKTVQAAISAIQGSQAAVRDAMSNLTSAGLTAQGGKLSVQDAQRNLQLAKNDAPLSKYAVTDAQAQLAADRAAGADAETLAKDEIALNDARANASSGAEAVKRAEIDLANARLTEKNNISSLTAAHTKLNESLAAMKDLFAYLVKIGILKAGKVKKFHGGGMFNSGAGEGLALLRDGEGVFTPAQMRAIGAGTASSGNSGGSVINNFPAGINAPDVIRAQRQHNRLNGVTE